MDKEFTGGAKQLKDISFVEVIIVFLFWREWIINENGDTSFEAYLAAWLRCPKKLAVRAIEVTKSELGLFKPVSGNIRITLTDAGLLVARAVQTYKPSIILPVRGIEKRYHPSRRSALYLIARIANRLDNYTAGNTLRSYVDTSFRKPVSFDSHEKGTSVVADQAAVTYIKEWLAKPIGITFLNRYTAFITNKDLWSSE